MVRKGQVYKHFKGNFYYIEDIAYDSASNDGNLKKVVIKEKKVDTILTKSNLPIAGYSINTYVGCPFGCEYCYATFMK